MKSLILALSVAIIVSFTPQAFGQTGRQIKNDVRYIYGSAPRTAPECDGQALSMLESKIADRLRSDYTATPRHELCGTDITLSAQVEGIVGTFGPRIDYLAENLDSGDERIRYIESEKLTNVFAQRAERITQLAESVESAESRADIAQALRYCYWAEILLASMPRPQELTFPNRKGERVNLKEWLPEKQKSIIKGMSVEFVRSNASNENVTELLFKYNGRPVKQVDYRYSTGGTLSKLYCAKDGRGVIDVPKSVPVQQIAIEYRYEYVDNSIVGKEVAAILKALKAGISATEKTATRAAAPSGITTSDARSAIYRKITDVINNTAAANRRPVFMSGLSTVDDTSKYENALIDICSAIVSNNRSGIDTLFTSEGYDIFTRLIGYGNVCLLPVDSIVFYSLNGEVSCRKIPMSFSFANNSRTFVEDVVFSFNPEGKVSNITFSLDREAADNILGQELWSEEARMILVGFLENYKTAYALKRLDYIESVFDDDALIITGRVFQRTMLDSKIGTNRYVELTKQSKKQYIGNLERCFRSNEYINIGFSDNKVVKMGKGGEIFGIQIRQNYFSTNYADEGYLFLMVDLNDPSRPVIHVRTWQPEADSQYGIIGPYHF